MKSPYTPMSSTSTDVFSVIGLFVSGVLLAALMIFISGAISAYFVQWIWNDTLIYVVTWAKPLTFWQAWAISILSAILFKPAYTHTKKKE